MGAVAAGVALVYLIGRQSKLVTHTFDESTFRLVTFYILTMTKQRTVIFLQPLEVGFNSAGDFLGVFDGKKMANNLTVVFRLARQSQSRVKFLGNLVVTHDLHNLCRIR